MKERYYGWTGKLLRVDLTSKTVSVEDWDSSWVGGRGFGMVTMFNEEPVGGEEFDPERLLIFSSGPLNGTIAPSSSRLTISSRNLLTGGCSTSSAGGFFAPEMKFAGYDHILFTGRAGSPVYVYIKNDEVKILDASHLWGKDTWETESSLRHYHRDPWLRVACIGPAGENRVRFACIIVERGRAAGWGGNGAVMGAKNLKAIAIRGTNPIYIARPSGFLCAVKRAREKLDEAPMVKALREGGSIGLVGGKFDPLTYRNFQDDTWDPAKVALVTQKVFKQKYEKRRVGCFNCSISCGRFYNIEEGKYAGLKMEGVQINALRGLGSNLDIASPADIIKANAICNQYGLNIDGIASLVGWVLDCFQKGVISERDLGYGVQWGNIESFIKLTQDVTYRQGLGDVLAEGIHRASKVIGKGSEKLAVLTKGIEINEGRMRSHRAWALGIMTSRRGGGHLDGAPVVEGIEAVGLDRELFNVVYGIPNIDDAKSYDHKADLVVWTERLKMLVDMLGICCLISAWYGPTALVAEDFYQLYSEATGDNKSASVLLGIAEKAINIEKAFNTLQANFTRDDDYPPSRLLNEPIKSGLFKGTTIDKNKWEKMLDEYYELHGWDKRTGKQTESGLRKLGLEKVANRLAKEGRLIG
jgi:aldehyde:ferredoxin oxidoreductase